MGTLQFFGSLLMLSLFCYTYACDYYYEEVTLESLLPSSDCPRSPPRRGSMKVISMHGPCFGNDAPTPLEILYDDQFRVAKMQDAVSTFVGLCLPSEANHCRSPGLGDFVAMSGAYLASRSFVVTVKLGSEEEEVSLIFDTGSDLTWTQCQPCEKSCYNQRDPIYDPTQSSSYSDLPPDSPFCGASTSTSKCVYSISYADGSYSEGNLAEEKITPGADRKLIFGCGQENKGTFGKTAGIFGLGRGPMSILSQTDQNFFSYCLPSQSSATGYLSFGNSRVPDSVKFTPLVKNSKGPSLYFVHLEGIRVGGNMLQIPKMVFSTAGTIIDSGTVITRLPMKAYAELRRVFRSLMKGHTLTSPLADFLDTCYDFHAHTTVRVPSIEFIFHGDVVMEVKTSRIFYTASRKDPRKQCLAFAGNKDDDAMGILGSYQQVTQHMVFDLAGGRLGIGKGGCQ